MSIITLITDFGVADEYVGVMKGVMLSIHPQVAIVDISHEIEPQNIQQAAFMLAAAYPYFTKGSVHVVVVDPGVGTDRRIVCLQTDGHRFLAPDNGVLTLLMARDPGASITWLENEAHWLTPVSGTFHGRDIFAPVAARLAEGLATHQLGRKLTSKDLVHLDDMVAVQTERGDVVGRVVNVDHFGNLMTNIQATLLQGATPGYEDGDLTLEVGDAIVPGVGRCYGEADTGRPLVLVNSRGYLEIAVNKGSAAQIYQVGTGAPVKVIKR